MNLYTGADVVSSNLETESLRDAKVSALVGGGFAVAWRYSVTDIYVRTYDQNGFATTTNEVKVLAGLSNLGGFDMVGSASGGVDIAWNSAGADGDDLGVGHLSTNGLGTVVGTNDVLNSNVTGAQKYPGIATFGETGFISAYTSEVTAGTFAVFFRAFNADGGAIELNGSGIDAQVNQTNAMIPSEVEIATLENGTFVVTWTSDSIGLPADSQDGSGKGIFHRVFNSDGTALTSETQVNTGPDSDQNSASVTALKGGGYVIAWEDSGSYDGANRGIFQKIYNSSGEPITNADMQVNLSTSGNQYAPDVTELENGGWVVVWQSLHEGNHIYQKAYDADGNVVVEEMRVSVTGNNLEASVTGVDDGGWVVSWTNAAQAIHHRRFGFTYEAPEGFDKTVTIKEDKAQALSANYFGFDDADNNALSGVIINGLPTKGTLKLNNTVVQANDMIDASDLGNLTYTPPANASGTGLAKINFKVVDDGGTAYDSVDTDVTANILTFNVTEVVDVFTGNDRGTTLTGTQGTDKFLAKGGNDKLNGLGGVDTFQFRTGDDKDTINDFVAKGTAHDILDLSDLSSITSFNDLKANHMDQLGKNVVIDGLGGDMITLVGVKLADLDKGDFLF